MNFYRQTKKLIKMINSTSFPIKCFWTLFLIFWKRKCAIHPYLKLRRDFKRHVVFSNQASNSRLVRIAEKSNERCKNSLTDYNFHGSASSPVLQKKPQRPFLFSGSFSLTPRRWLAEVWLKVSADWAWARKRPSCLGNFSDYCSWSALSDAPRKRSSNY